MVPRYFSERNAFFRIVASITTLAGCSAVITLWGSSYGARHVSTHALFATTEISSVTVTLLEAILLIFLMMRVFLGRIRPALVPTIAAAVALLCTYLLMNSLSFELQTPILIALAPAIALLADDAIAMVEQVESTMAEKKHSAVEAVRYYLDHFGFGSIALGSSLLAISAALLFLTDFRPSLLMLIISLAVSGFVTATVTPALCTLLAKTPETGPRSRQSLFRQLPYEVIFLLLLAVLELLFLTMPGRLAAG